MYGRFALGLRKYLKERPTLEESRQAVEEGLANRERNFLRLLKIGVYGNPRSPYLALLRHAGLSYDHVETLVNMDGLEGALVELRERGVYVTFEEFKGRTPIERAGLRIETDDRSFDNPALKEGYEGQSSGSTGAGTRVAMDLDHMSAMLKQAIYYIGLRPDMGEASVVWFPILPATTGIMAGLMFQFAGLGLRRWFTPVTSAKMKIPFRYTAATAYARAMARLFGLRVPAPEALAVSEAETVARTIHDLITTEGHCVLATYVSLAVRVAIAARENGLDLSGALFIGAGEPPTPAKVRAIRSCGASWLATYGLTEGGMVGLGCMNPSSENDLHVWRDAWAVTQNPVQVPGSNLMVDAFCFTSLLSVAPKIMLNVELDDYGVLERRDCGCPMQTAGFPDHVRDIFSFRKLTGEGMTLVGSTMLKILEEVLPREFGGSALDYQLVEEEDANGFTRLTIVISPDVGELDDAAVMETVLDEVSRDSPGADLARAIWRDAGTLRIRRADPTWSTLGKLLSLRPAGKNAGIVYETEQKAEEAGVA
jgi:hypothetical protein